MSEPWDYGDNTPEPNWFEKIIIICMIIISTIFFRPPKGK